ncbi:LysR family transcriptional regulator [Tianweitania sp. Rool2]|uniref:LysR family transcriptional regulator n=1 Tax=Oryzicola mucosus TaxID=2767425 RepID=A0A8J6PEC3_9HYPH|nr:LysR family transcriptional regulator [Oryzicola mucosus]
MKKTHAVFSQLPHLRALPAFAAAARFGSLTDAARQLNVTPGAVSRQVKTLEDSLGVALFVRSHNAIVLTEAGTRFLSYVNSSLAMLDEGARTLAPQSSKLVINAPITFVRRWLIPRLPSFSELHTDIALRSLSLGASEKSDVSIIYRRTDAPSQTDDIVLRDTTVAVCAPRLLTMIGRDPSSESILSLPLLLDTEDAWSWHRWSAAAGIQFQPRHGTISLDTDEASIDACLSGLGVAQASPEFVESELRSGQLVMLKPNIMANVGVYFLQRAPTSPLGVSFRAWLETARF